MNSIEFGEARLQEFEQRLSKINSRLSTALDTVGAELETLKGVSDDISTLYETLDRLESR